MTDGGRLVPPDFAARVEEHIAERIRAGKQPSTSEIVWMRSWPSLMASGEPHPWYGLCDGLEPDGGCSECARAWSESPDSHSAGPEFRSSCTHPEFIVWWDRFGAALVDQLSPTQLALAAWAVAEERSQAKVVALEQEVHDSHAVQVATNEDWRDAEARAEAAEQALAQLRSALEWYRGELFREADALDKETGDNKDDLIRAGQQTAYLTVARELESIAAPPPAPEKA